MDINSNWKKRKECTRKKASQTNSKGSLFRAMNRKAILGIWTLDWETNWRCNELSPTTSLYCICINNKLPKQITTTNKIKTKSFLFHLCWDFCCWITFFFIFHTNPFKTKTSPPFSTYSTAESNHKKQNFDIHLNIVALSS